MSTVERLEELLEHKDAELEKRAEKIDTLERKLRFGVDWMLHQHSKAKEERLPVPRIQLTMTHGEDRYQEYSVDMVLPNRDGTVTYVPVCYSKSSGGRMEVAQFPTQGALPDDDVNNLPSIINDACFLMEKTGITAYVRLDPDHVYQITSLRPLQLRAV
jgi:hypothetical protein